MKRNSTRTIRSRFCTISIGKGVLTSWKPEFSLKKGRAFILTESRFRKQSGLLLRRLGALGWEAQVFFLKSGEGLKDFKSVYPIYGKLMDAGADRHSVLFALGGGTIGDAVGFVAATALRGIPWVGIPSTLLAQIDSSIGGKTGINHERGKNLIGAFHQPRAVICDLDFLKSLPVRERISGLGEMLKYGLILDQKFFFWLARHWRVIVDPKADLKFLAQAISHCIEFKTRVVESDERELNGKREVLNFGHTIGHAVETLSKHSIKHGEAVIFGMRVAVELSKMKNGLSVSESQRIESVLKEIPIPKLAHIRVSDIVGLTRQDKKARAGRPRFVLLTRIGKANPGVFVSETEIHEALRAVLARGHA